MDLHLKLITAADHQAQAAAAYPGVLALANDIDVAGISLEGVERIDLHFPSFADGRAFSQAFQLRRRRGFAAGPVRRPSRGVIGLQRKQGGAFGGSGWQRHRVEKIPAKG